MTQGNGTAEGRKPVCELAGTDGNVFSIIARVKQSLKEAGEATPPRVSMAKMNNVQIALDAARTTRDILGANGITDDYQCMRHMMNLESVYTYEGTHDIHKLVVGKELTGIAAFS